MGCCCCTRQPNNNRNIPSSKQSAIVNKLTIEPPPLIVNPQPVVLPESPLIKKLKKKQLDIREINLLEISLIVIEDQKSTISEKSNQSIIKTFEQKIEEIETEYTQFINSKQVIENQLIKSFDKDENNLQNHSENQEFIGVKVTNRNICDIKNKYDFSKVNQFTEYNGQITIVRLIQKQKSSICTYLGKIDQKYCCVKLIPMAKRIHIDKWIKSVDSAQQSKDDNTLQLYFQKYYYYKIEKIIDQPQYCNCYIISNLEQYNVYTFSHHPSVTLTEKVLVAPYIIQIISLALQKKVEYNFQESNLEKISAQIFKTIFTVKRNNILISRIDNQKEKFKIVLSDWQLLLPEFEQIIPNKILQNQDKFYEKIQQQVSEIIQSNYSNLVLASQKSQIQQEENQQKNVESLPQLADQFSKYFMKLLFFRSNFELQNDVSLQGFQNENEFEGRCEILRTISNNDINLQEKIVKQIKENLKFQNEPDQIEYMNKKSQEICNLFQLNPQQNMKSIYEVFLVINKLSAEGMRSHFIQYNEAISHNVDNQSKRQDQ